MYGICTCIWLIFGKSYGKPFLTLLGSYASILFWGNKCWFEAELLFFVAWWFGITKKDKVIYPIHITGKIEFQTTNRNHQLTTS